MKLALKLARFGREPALYATLTGRLLAVGAAVLMSLWTHSRWPEIFFLAWTGVSLIAPEISSSTNRNRAWAWAARAAWAGSTVLFLNLIISVSKHTGLDTYYAVWSWIMGGAVSLTTHRVSDPLTKVWWKALVLAWAVAGEVIWIAASYAQNLPGLFYIGLILCLALLIACRSLFQMPGVLILGANTLILFIIFLPVVDWVMRAKRSADRQSDITGEAYSYNAAKQDRHTFLNWWGKYLEQYDRLMKVLFIPDPTHVLPYLVRTNTEMQFFHSRVVINSRGFRGREVALEKGGTYRIVALGESTTFGFTLTPEHKPWPELLDQLIQQRLVSSRRIEVINAGLPHHNLKDNLYRLRKDILALKPDMIISYHGWNGFQWLWASLPPIFEKHIPVFKPRPVQLLAQCEYRLKMMIFKRRLAASPPFQAPPLTKLLQTKYADAYRELILLCKTNHIQLAIANHSLAVNNQSDPAVIEFYREAFPGVYAFIKVNLLHSLLVKTLCEQNRELCFVDTNPHLDGEHEKFIDLVHFAPEGDHQMAETMFASITNVLCTTEIVNPAP